MQHLDVLASVNMKQFPKDLPTAATADTLNLSAAAAIVAYERHRQRRRAPRMRWLWSHLRWWKKSSPVKLDVFGFFSKPTDTIINREVIKNAILLRVRTADHFNSSSSIRSTIDRRHVGLCSQPVNPTCQDVQDNTEGSAFRKAAMLLVRGPRWMGRWYVGRQKSMTFYSFSFR